MGWAEKVLEIVGCGKLGSRWLLLGPWRCDLWPAPHTFNLPDPMDCALFFFRLACLTGVWTTVSSSSLFAWDFPSFKTGSTMSWAAPSLSKLAQLVTPILTHLRPHWAGPLLLSLRQVDLTSGRLAAPACAVGGGLQGNRLLRVPVKQSLPSCTVINICRRHD